MFAHMHLYFSLTYHQSVLMEPLAHSVAPLDRETRMLAAQALLETRASTVRLSVQVFFCVVQMTTV